ncbi:hypothetical protein [Paraburkholderia metrosideri]|uniref:DUF1833 domain-containing protein n=1 Tax=Paraburkholderia metrosideri TaxID=580937 RepID=A0ABN7HH13_9BURK|nr:hypothetical protein [Paraburkholderia metrosideri]CAD6516022.1 hypothetical protein LMG28140_00698 [Paraburkholderia metrosideri]
MNGIEMFDLNPNLIAMGRLELLKSFECRLKQSIGLRGDMPVLTCPVAAVDADCFEMRNGEANFGFGTIRLSSGLVQSIRVQVNDIQIYWLADMTDPEVWAAIDMWRQAKRAPIQFDVRGEPGEAGHSLFMKMGVPQGTYQNEQFRNAPMPPAERIWKEMVTLADSGMLQSQAETDIEGIPLRRVFVNVLFTERFKPCVDVSSLTEMPVRVEPVFRKVIFH